jgi:hypothetical protein
VELVQSATTVLLELNLELKFLLADRLFADLALGSDSRTAPGPIGGTGGSFPFFRACLACSRRIGSSGMAGWLLCCSAGRNGARCHGVGRPGASTSSPMEGN